MLRVGGALKHVWDIVWCLEARSFGELEVVDFNFNWLSAFVQLF